MIYICAKLVASSVSPYFSPTPSPLEFGLCLESGKRIMARGKGGVFFNQQHVSLFISNNLNKTILYGNYVSTDPSHKGLSMFVQQQELLCLKQSSSFIQRVLQTNNDVDCTRHPSLVFCLSIKIDTTRDQVYKETVALARWEVMQDYFV